MNNNLVNEILSDVHRNENYEFDSEGSTEYRKTLALMRTDLNLIAQPLTNQAYITLTGFGKTVCDNGGWLKHLELEKQKADTEKVRQELTDEKLKYDVKNAKRIFKTYWWTFWFSVIALIISLVLGALKLLEWLQPPH